MQNALKPGLKGRKLIGEQDTVSHSSRVYTAQQEVDFRRDYQIHQLKNEANIRENNRPLSDLGIAC